MLTLHVGTATDIGRVREINEDSLCSGSTLFAVADGMGGHTAGDVASRIVVDCLQPLRDRQDLRPEDLRAELAHANREILDHSQASPQLRGMGTTVTGIGLVSFAGTDHWVVFNVGDSRVYRYVGGVLVQLTVDHSEVEEMVGAGRLSSAEARLHPRRNVVTRALGTDPGPEADLRVVPPIVGERFVLCSDGLNSEIDDGQIAEVLRHQRNATEAADALVQAALDAGGRDNVTVIVVDHVGVEHPDAMLDAEDTTPRSGRSAEIS